MSTPAVYTFKGDPNKGQKDLHLVYHSDGYPSGAADKIPVLAKLAERIWAGEDVNLEALNLPGVDEVTRRETLAESKPATPYRYEIQVVEGRQVITATQHAPVISDELEKRHKAAEAAFKAVEAEMRAAYGAATYKQIGKGSLEEIRKLGLEDE